MTLSVITIDDRQRIVKVLELPIRELEKSGELYSALIELEDRQDRLAVDLVTQLRDLLTQSELVKAEIDAIRDGSSTSKITSGASASFNIFGEYFERVAGLPQRGFIDGEVVSPQSGYALLLTRLNNLKKDIHRLLNLYRRTEGAYNDYYYARGNRVILG